MQEPIVVSAKFNASKQKLWNAITNANEMRQWFFASINHFEPIVGFRTEFVVKNEERKFTHIWSFEDVIPLQKIKYNWHYTEYEGDSEVCFELQQLNNATQLTVTHSTIKPFTANIPEFKRESGVQGWNYLIKESLKNYLQKTNP